MNYDIWISKESNEDYDINVWDIEENERVDNLEIGCITDYNQAETVLQKIINENTNINFIRKEDIIM